MSVGFHSNPAANCLVFVWFTADQCMVHVIDDASFSGILIYTLHIPFSKMYIKPRFQGSLILTLSINASDHEIKNIACKQVPQCTKNFKIPRSLCTRIDQEFITCTLTILSEQIASRIVNWKRLHEQGLNSTSYNVKGCTLQNSKNQERGVYFKVQLQNNHSYKT